jgi:hypothetical protein
MAEPYNYMLNVPDPTQSVVSGVQRGIELAALMDERKLRQAKIEKQKRLENAISSLGDNPTVEQIGAIMRNNPDISGEFTTLYNALSESEQQERLGQAQRSYAATLQGRPDIAAQILNEAAVAYENAGRANDAKAMRDQAALVEADPNFSKTVSGLFLASAMGPEKFAQSFSNFESARVSSEQARVAEGTSGAQIAKAKADADKAAVQARFAESQAVADLTQAGWNISKIQQDMGIARQNQAIAAMEAERKKTTDALRQQELTQKIETAKFNRDQAVKEAAAANENAYADIDVALQNINSILTTVKKDPDILRDITGTLDSLTPTLGGEEANLEEKINTLKSQAFLSQVAKMRGLGALTAPEGARLETNIASLSLRQTPEQIISNLTAIENVMMSGLERYRKALGLPEQTSLRALREQAVTEEMTDDELVQKYLTGDR